MTDPELGLRNKHSFCDTSFYEHMALQCRRNGLRTEEVDRSARKLVKSRGRLFVLKDLAFKPTGVALGRPLPDNCFANQLWSVAQIIDCFLGILDPVRYRRFGFVPRSWYHVTVVNWTHFDENLTVTNMTRRELKTVKTAISNLNQGPLSICFCGLLLTAEGRILVPGYPKDGALGRVRRCLSKQVPAFAAHLPPAAHIKLGHVLLKVEGEAFQTMYELVKLLGRHINTTVDFHDLYTPAGRLPLGAP